MWYPALNMNDKSLSIIIKAQDQASKVLREVEGNIDSTTNSVKGQSGVMQKLSGSWGAVAGIAASAGVALYGVKNGLDASVQSANTLQASLAGLESIAVAFGQSATSAKIAAQKLASDGLMTVAESATGLKNLLASGFSLDQAVTLMNRFKDSAAFGRQASLGFGQAIASATEGIKNGNSVLVDNAGVTKNLSLILQDAGFSQNDLMKATTDSNIRMAIFNGIIKETAPMLGNASTLAEQFAGAQAKASAQTETLKQKLGIALQPVMSKILKVVTPMIEKLSQWVEENPKLSAAIAIATVALLAMVAAVGALGAAMLLLAPLVAAVGAVVLGVIGGIAVGVAAAVALIIVYWQPISAFFSNLWGGISSAVSNAIDWITGKIMWFKDNWAMAIGFIIGFFATLPIKLPFYIFQAINAIVGYLMSVNWGGIFSGIGRAFGGAMSALWDWAVGTFNRILGLNWGSIFSGAAKGIGNSILGLLEGAINGALSGLPGNLKVHIPRFEKGVRGFSGGMAVVGERGPELVNLPRGANVYSNAESQAMSSGSAFNMYGNINLGDASAVDRFFERLNAVKEMGALGVGI